MSVVTPVYNEGRFVAECIESVLSQTYARFEYVISENHSTDDTPSIVAEYARSDSRIRVVRPSGLLPAVAHWNFAWAQTSRDSSHVKFVHADDRLAPTCLEHMLEVAGLDSTVGMVGALRSTSDGTVELDGVPPATGVVPGRWLVRHQLLGGPYTTGSPTSTLLCRDRVGRTKPYDESYVHADDALSFSVLLGSNFGYVAEPLTWTRRHSGSESSRNARVGTWLPEHLRMTLEFGVSVLTRHELARAVSRLESKYVRMLSKSTLSLKLARDREVLRFHRDALEHIERAAEAASHPLSPPLLAYAAILARKRADDPVAHLGVN